MILKQRTIFIAIMAGVLLGCSNPSNSTSTIPVDPKAKFNIHKAAQFDEPWAMAFLPDGRLLVTEKKGNLKLFDIQNKTSKAISGVPEVAYGGQGGLGDIVLHPQFSNNHLVYFSYAEKGSGGKGAVVARATLNLAVDGTQAVNRLSNIQVIWRQVPKVSGSGHYGHRIAFDKHGMLWIASGERQKFDPAQDMQSNLGKIIRLHDDGRVPQDNPFVTQGGVAAQVWSLGHRNPLGIAFNSQGQLWEIEMGPKGGDELNLIEKSKNYGYPIVSNGDHYSGIPIPDHATRPEFQAPAISWTPVISPSSLMFYDGSQFPAWKGNAFAGGLSSESLVRIEFTGNTSREAERFAMGARIRDVAQGPDGDLWLLEDGEKAHLIQLSKR